MKRAALAAALLCAAYANHFTNAFHFDDAHVVQQNLAIRDLRNVPRFFIDASTFSSLPANQSYRPLLTATLAVDWAVGRDNPLAYHVQTFLWYALECALVFLLFRRALRDDGAAFFGAMLFALHPANAETVNYVSARSDILSALGAVATVWLWTTGSRWHVLPAVLGTLAKEQGAMAAPLLLAWMLVVEKRPWTAALRAALPVFVACGATGVLAIAMAPHWSPGGTSRLQYALTQPWAIAHYAAMFVLPLQLSADTDWTVVSDWRVWAGVAFLVALIAAAVLSKRSAVQLGIAWFLLALLPTSSVVPLAEVVNDHRMHFAFVGLALAAAEVLPRRRVAWAALLAVCTYGTWQRNRVWRTEETLWADTVVKSPRNGRAWMNYGLALMARGDYANAQKAYERALPLTPQYSYLHVNYAIVLAAQGHLQEAERWFRSGVALGPAVPTLRYFYARWLDQQRRTAEAVAQLEQALLLAPNEAAWRELLQSIRARTNSALRAPR